VLSSTLKGSSTHTCHHLHARNGCLLSQLTQRGGDGLLPFIYAALRQLPAVRVIYPPMHTDGMWSAW
jgi:hypothetical protein